MRSRLLGSMCACTVLACGSATEPESAIYQSLEAADAGEPTCSMQEIELKRSEPTFWVVVDGSGSMLEPLSMTETTSRWEALRSALLDEQSGVLKNVGNAAQVGLLMYDGPLLADGAPMTPSGPATTCPRTVLVEPGLDNFEALNEGFTPDPLGGSTPTDKALEVLIERGTTSAAVILATDGQPNDFCTAGPVADVRGRVVEDVKKLATLGNQVSVISLAGEDAALTQHLADVAAASGTGKPVFAPQTTAALAETVRELTSIDVSCDIELSGEITRRQARRVRFELNGRRLERNDADGWRVSGPTTLQMTGEACEEFSRDARSVVRVSFPCQ